MYYERTGLNNIPLLLNLISKKQLLAIHCYMFEDNLRRAQESSERRGHIVYQTYNVVDCAGVGKSHYAAMGFLKELSHIDQEYYPECMNKLVIVNAPWIVTAMWKVIRMWLNERTRNKVTILGSDFKAVLQDDIDKEFIPEEYGGTSAYVVPKPDTNGLSFKSDDPPLKEEKIPTGKSFETVVLVEKEADTIHWFFRSEGGDVGRCSDKF